MPRSCPDGKISIEGKCKSKDKITIQELAGEWSKYFKTQKRNNDEEFLILDENAPKELHDIVMEAHGDMLPDDWKYEFSQRAIQILADIEDPDDAGEEIDSSVDVYNHNLLKWLSSNNSRLEYVDEAVEEMGGHGDSIINDIQMGQYREREEVYYDVLNGLKKVLKKE